MAGSVLGPDQIKKLNGLYPALVAHVRELLQKDHSGVGLMRVHRMVESFDSDEMARIFRELSFISGQEKLSLVRAAIYELMATDPSLFVSPKVETIALAPVASRVTAPVEVPFVPGFKLNVNKAADLHGQAPADIDGRDPKVTSTMAPHIAKASEMLKAGDEQQKEHAIAVSEAAIEAVARVQAKHDAAMAKLRAATTPEVAIEPLPNIPDAPVYDDETETEDVDAEPAE